MTIKEIQDIVDVGRHNHKATEADIDKCAKCGHDIRHPIHLRANREDNETVSDVFLSVVRDVLDEVGADYNPEKYTTGSHADSLAMSARAALSKAQTRIESKIGETK